MSIEQQISALVATAVAPLAARLKKLEKAKGQPKWLTHPALCKQFSLTRAAMQLRIDAWLADGTLVEGDSYIKDPVTGKILVRANFLDAPKMRKV